MNEVKKIAIEIKSGNESKSTRAALDALKEEYGIDPSDNANHMYGNVTTGMYE